MGLLLFISKYSADSLAVFRLKGYGEM